MHSRQRALPVLAGLALAIFMTWPLAPRMASVARTGVGPNANPHFGNNADGLFSIWNVSWVARTAVADPIDLFDANIFYPHENTLAYSEANIVPGLLGVPAWWLTKNPYATVNSVILFAFASAWLCAWLFLRYLTGHSGASAVGAIAFAFCPYVFSHTAHIQLMMTGGIPLSMLMLHRLADHPSIRRGLALGLALLVQALACAYYGIFAGLMVGYGTLWLAASRSLFGSVSWWKGIAAAVALSVAGAAPFFYPYLGIGKEDGFLRALEHAIPYSADAASYLASDAKAHQWLLRIVQSTWGKWNEVMFPGILPIVLGAAGLVLAVVRRRHGAPREGETIALYVTLGALAAWASFGPEGGLYSLLYKSIPAFALLRAPSRLAIVVVLCLVVPAAFAVRRILHAVPSAGRTIAAGAFILIAIADVWISRSEMPWERAIVIPAEYSVLAHYPRGAIAEFPFYAGPTASHLHTQYMLFSTSHWMPMLNGYSDHTPPGFRRDSAMLERFTSNDSFEVLRRMRVRYAGVHWDMFGPRAEEIRSRLHAFQQHLRPLASSERMTIYEVVSFP